MKRLLVMRHAKSDWQADYGSDHDRPLNDRGIRSAKIMGRVLSDLGHVPGHIVSSPALRARRTAELAREAGDWRCSLALDRVLYEDRVVGVISAISNAPNIERLMIVGHQPTWSLLVAELTGRKVVMKTASVAVLDVPIGSWAEIPATPGSLVELLSPRDFWGTEWDPESL